MAIFPGLDEFSAAHKFNQTQTNWLAATQFIVVIFNTAVLVWLGCNARTILIKQGKYRVLPLLIFYSVATLLVLLHQYNTIWIWAIIRNNRVCP